MSSQTRTNSKKWLVVVAAVVVLAAAAGVVAWAMRSPEPPAPTADVAALAKFVRTSAYNDLPEAQKRPYMKALRKGSKELIRARNEGRISQNDYEEAYLNAYFERKLDDMEEFYEIPEAKRKQVLLAEYVKKNREKTATTAASAPEPPKPDEEKEDDFMEDRVETWPPEERAKWEEFRKAVKEAKQAAKNVK